MKKIILFFSIVLISKAGFSQFVIFGVKGGLNLASFTANYIESPKLLPSFHIGGLANFLISEKFMLQPELIYSGKGAKYSGGNFRFGYVNIPVLAQYKTPSGFFAEAGPQVGFLINAKQKIDGQDTYDIKDDMKTTDFSWLFGLGYKTASGFGAGARYDFGYYNVAKAGTIKPKTILVTLFYTFGGVAE